MRFDFKKYRHYLFIIVGVVLLLWALQFLNARKTTTTIIELKERLEVSSKRIALLKRDSIATRQRIKDLLARGEAQGIKENEQIIKFVSINEKVDYSKFTDSKLDSARAWILSRY